jgi:hypothetical protein
MKHAVRRRGRKTQTKKYRCNARSVHYQEVMAPWLIIMGSGLDDWIYWQLLLKSLLIIIDYNNSQSIFSRTLLWLARTRSILVLRLLPDLRLHCFIASRRIHRKHIRCPTMDICEPHTKHRFFYCRIYRALHSNGNYPIIPYVFVVAYC